VAHIALYRAFRPQTFDEVVAQKHIVYPLRQSVRNKMINHALLFAGTRGTGKTSLAKIYAKAINCKQPDDGNPCNKCEICLSANDGSLLDIVEMDAASHNSVENIRKMTEEVIYTPVSAAFKVYIIDEAHMLSGGAFNALLKTLEEPPSHAVFILATTEAHRIPATIASRCQRYDFRRIGSDDIQHQLQSIAKAEKIAIDQGAIKTIASLADGALRDAISLLDQVSGGVEGDITRQHVLDLVGLTSDQAILTLIRAIVERKPDALLTSVEELSMSGRDLNRLTLDLAQQFRNLLVIKFADDATSISQLPDDVLAELRQIAPHISTNRLIRIVQKLSELLSDLRFSGQPRTTLEIGLLSLLADPSTTEDSSPLPTAKPKKETAPETTTAKAQPTTDSVKAKPVEKKASQSDVAADKKMDLLSTLNEASEEKVSAQEKEVVEVKEPAKAEPRKEEKEEAVVEEVVAVEDASKVAEPAEPVAPKQEVASTATETESATEEIDHLDLLEIWEKVLDDLSANNRMDLRLMAKSAEVSLDDRVFTIRFKQGMTGAYQLVSKQASVELITSYVVKHLDRPVSVSVAIGDEGGQATAEEEWLRALRERT